MLFILQLAGTSSSRINNAHKYANSTNNGAREVGISLFDVVKDDKHTSVGSVEVSKIFAMQDADFFRMTSFDTVCKCC